MLSAPRDDWKSEVTSKNATSSPLGAEKHKELEDGAEPRSPVVLTIDARICNGLDRLDDIRCVASGGPYLSALQR